MLLKRSMVRSLTVASLALLFAVNLWAADATIEFTDNAPNATNPSPETGFKVFRSLNGGASVELLNVPASVGSGLTVSVTDTTLVQSNSQDNVYCYDVAAYNAAGQSPFGTWVGTRCKTIPMLITIPAGPTGRLVK